VTDTRNKLITLQLLYNAGMAIPEMYPVGSITALIPEAADAAISGATLATGTEYAVGALTLGGFEKTVEVNPLHTDYVIFSPSGVYHDDVTPTVYCI